METRERERFRRGMRWYRSTRGYSLAFPGRSHMEYRDALGTFVIAGEPLAGKPFGFWIYSESSVIRDEAAERQVLDNIRRMFEHYGWRLREGQGLGGRVCYE